MGYNTNPECYVVSDGNNSNNNLLTAALMGGGGGFGFGGGYNSPFWAIILLGLLRNGGLFGNNWDNNGAHPCTTSQLTAIQETLNTNHGQTLVMDAIKGNSSSLHELATTIGCNQNALTAAINAVQSAICNVSNQVGMTSAQVINAINNGNMSLANTLQSCCCDMKQLVQTQGYENRINNIEQSNMITKGFGDTSVSLERGFANVNYATQAQTNALAQNNDANTRAVLAKIDAVEDNRKNEKIADLTAQLATVNARAERQAELAPIVQALNDIKCKQPNTVTVPYQPFVTVPNCVAWNAALYGNFPYANGGNFG